MTEKTRNLCKKILHNPFFIALLLTVLAMIIIVAVFKNYSYGGAANVFKIGFYMFICFSIILFLNNMFLKRTMANTHIKTEVKEVFTGIDMSKEMSHDIIQINPNLYEDQNILGGDIGSTKFGTTGDKFKSTNYDDSNDNANNVNANNDNANNVNASNDNVNNDKFKSTNYDANNDNYSNVNASNVNASNVNASNVNYSNEEEKKDINTILDSIITISNQPISNQPNQSI